MREKRDSGGRTLGGKRSMSVRFRRSLWFWVLLAGFVALLSTVQPIVSRRVAATLNPLLPGAVLSYYSYRLAMVLLGFLVALPRSTGRFRFDWVRLAIYGLPFLPIALYHPVFTRIHIIGWICSQLPAGVGAWLFNFGPEAAALLGAAVAASLGSQSPPRAFRRTA